MVPSTRLVRLLTISAGRGASTPKAFKPSGWRAYVPRVVGMPRVLGLELMDPSDNSGHMGLVPDVRFTLLLLRTPRPLGLGSLRCYYASDARAFKPYTTIVESTSCELGEGVERTCSRHGTHALTDAELLSCRPPAP